MRRPLPHFTALCALTVFTLCAGSANAALVTFRIDGIVTSGANAGNLLPFVYATGSNFTAFYTFETSTPDYDSFVDSGSYMALTSVTMQQGSQEFTFAPSPTTDSNTINIGNTATSDQYVLNAGSMPSSPTFTGTRYHFDLLLSEHSDNPTAMTSTLLSSTSPVLEFFNTSRTFSFDAVQRQNGAFVGLERINGTVTSISAVPLPAAGWLLLSGLGGIATAARRRKVKPTDGLASV